MTVVPFITLADGRRIDTTTGAIVEQKDSPITRVIPVTPEVTPEEPFEPAQQRTLLDLPEAGPRANVVALAVALQLFGLSDDEIALQMRTDVEAVRGLLSSKSVADFRTAVVDGVSRRYEPRVRAILNEASVDAAQTLAENARRGKAGDRIKAASSILDRTGHTAVNTVEHRVGGGLVIEVVQRATRVPDVELEGV